MSTTAPLSHSRSASATTPLSQTLTPLESELLAEYALLLTNLQKLSETLHAMSETPTAQILDSLRLLERKTSLVGTLLKASVYSIVLQQQVLGEDAVGAEGPGD